QTTPVPMSPTGTGSLIEAVSDVAKLAGRVALSHFGKALTVDRKSDGSPVTIADRAAEQSARDWITTRFSGDGIVGEEFGSLGAGAERYWLIDPIDGTKAFVHGVPLWGTLIALCQG